MKKKQFLYAFLCLFFIQNGYTQLWTEFDKVVATDRQASDSYGFAVSINGDYAVVGSPDADLGPGKTNIGAAYIYERSGGEWVQIQKLTASDGKSFDHFGYSVAISKKAYGIIIGAPHQDYDASNTNYMGQAGAAYLFEKTPLGWVETEKFVATDREESAQFGHDVDRTTTTCIIGAIGERGDDTLTTINGSGAAYIFQKAISWEQEAKLVASDRAAGDFFGYSVCIEANTAVIGAPRNNLDVNDEDDITDAGAAYIFEQNALDPWIEKSKLTSSDRNSNELFGSDVDINKSTIVVGALGDKEDENGLNPKNNAGSAFIFKWNYLIDEWPLEAKLVATDRGANRRFGESVAITDYRILVGARLEGYNPVGADYKIKAGAAYIYHIDEDDDWYQFQKLVASDRDERDFFGKVDIYDDAIIIGAQYEDEDDSTPTPTNTMSGAGSAYVFHYNSFGPPGAAHSTSTIPEVDISSPIQLILHPNPSTGNAVLNLATFDSNKTYIITVYSLQGAIVFEGSSANFPYPIDLRSQKNGVYVVQVNDGTTTYFSKFTKI